jgi:hypothetical protein
MGLPLPVPLIEEPPEFEFRNGIFYVVWNDGDRKAYRPSTFFATLAAMAQAAREYRVGGAEVIPIKAPPDDHAA